MTKKSQKTYKTVRGIAFYLLFPAFILCLIAPFVHKEGFEVTQYFSQEAFMIPLIGTGVAILLALPKCTSRYACVVTFLVALASLLSFANVSYLYLSAVFFNGMAETLPGILEQMGIHYAFCALAYVGAMLLGIVAIFLPATKYKKVEA